MNRQTLLIGLGSTGFSIAKYLKHKNQSFCAYDTRQEPPRIEEFKKQFPDVKVFCESYPENLLQQIDRIILSPGVEHNIPILVEGRNLDITIENDLDCLYQEIKNAPVVAITGSNGKSTVTSWVGEIAKRAGLKVAVGGNLGTPVLDLWLAEHDYDLWVLELSSFQLAGLKHFHITASTVLNVTPDHLDMHGSMENYIQAKQRIYSFSENLIFNRDDPNTWPRYTVKNIQSFGLSTPTNHEEWGIISQGQKHYLAKGLDLWLDVDFLKLKGQHNWQNALATAALASFLGIEREFIIAGLKDFIGLDHRTQWVADINGVTFVNDSKGTNLGASIAAIDGIGPTLKGKIVLIAGGLGKGADFTPMRTSLTRFVKHAVLIGKDAPILAQYWKGAVDLSYALTLQEAVSQAFAMAEPGDLVLLSPACASFDMFNGFEHRGQQFSKLVQELKTC